MLPATQGEIEHVTEYMRSQAPELTVQLVQKVYSENVLHVRHDVWDVHTDVDRWWVITEPMNLYAQDQFPNMDLALTFHMPEQCPACGSQRLSPQRGYRQDFPDVEWERPTCDKCGWAGEPVPIDDVLEPDDESAPPG
jgi:hypothetical protein